MADDTVPPKNNWRWPAGPPEGVRASMMDVIPAHEMDQLRRDRDELLAALVWTGRLALSLADTTYDGIPGTRLDEADEARLREVDALITRIKAGK